MRDVIVIPTYNERENIERLVLEIFRVVPQCDIVVVDDNSPDGTAKIVQDLTLRYSQVHLIKRSKKDGLRNAYFEAFKQLCVDINVRAIITMDADFSHDPKYLPLLISLLDDSDLVIGSRYISGGKITDWNIIRRIISRFGNIYASLLAGIEVRDMTSGFMIIKRDKLCAALKNNIVGRGFSFLIELKYILVRTCSARVKEVPIIFRERKYGENKFSLNIFLEGFFIPLRLAVKRFITMIS